MDEAVAALQAEFCPPIDDALFSAIILDFSPFDHASLQQARETLELLKATAVAEEATGFDASGSGAHDDSDNAGSPASSPDTSATGRDTELSSLSNAMSSVDLVRDPSASTSASEDFEGIEQMDADSKARLLQNLFPSLSLFTISHALKKHQNAFRSTLDVLLNQVYLSEDGSGEAKGIEAFVNDTDGPRGRKKNKKTRKMRLEDDARGSSLPDISHAAPASNKWQSAAKDIEFVTLHLDMSREKVSSVYYQENASLQRTIASILDTWMDSNQHVVKEDVTIQVDAYELGREFPSLSEKHCTALIGITQPSTAGAHELAEALATRNTSQASSLQKVVPHYAPLSIAEDDDSTFYPAGPTSTRSSLDFAGASSQASILGARREAAMSQARAAYRKSKSDRLMGGAAAYYSQVGREYRDSSQAYNAAAADSLVASQSSANHIDLHGVTVDDAKRITHIKVSQWWNNLGENRFNGRVGASDRAAGFRIVTGVGKHSKSGRGVLGPAVKKLLEQEGWRIEVTSGEIIVRGKVKT